MENAIYIVHKGTGRQGVLISGKDAFGRVVVRYNGCTMNTVEYATEIFVY